ncbi:hypothetical protein F5Y09DRAFT_31061 [Xylaria sp. FL1042]|nr:hypothetical protein F5Y09DRAFT_31061 [Xylaria sp. FL1042]
MSSLIYPRLQSESEARISPPPRKLRDSCCNCAKSKLRCTKEKPICARCLRQGRACYYVPSKRAGRTRVVRLERRESEDMNYTIPMPAAVSPSEVAMPSGTELPRGMQVPMPQSLPVFRSNLSGTVSSFNEEYTISSPSTYTPQIFDMTRIPMYSPIFNSNDGTNHLEMVLPKAHSDTTSTPPIYLTANHTLISPTSDSDLEPPSTPTDPPSISQCSCLSRAFELLQKHPPRSSGGTSSISIPDHIKWHLSDQDKASHWAAEENRRHVEEMVTMVECTCSQEPYLLSLMSLVAFKIMGTYKIAARELRESGSASRHHHHPQQHLPFPVTETPTIVEQSYSIYNERIRTKAQSFLGEIRLVQQLVSSLSLRLRRLGAAGSGAQNAISSTHATSYAPVADISKTALGIMEENGSPPLPTTLLHQLEIDLRRQLRALSIEIVGGG